MDVEEVCGMEIVKVHSWRLKVHRWGVNVRRSMVKVNFPPKVINRGLCSIDVLLRVEFLKGEVFVVVYSIPEL